MHSFLADLHVHSHYSIATSASADLAGFYQWARVKGIRLVGTGDFTHPGWLQEIRDELVPAEEGFFRLKEPPSESLMTCRDMEVRFTLTAEISSIYKKGGKTRKVHSLVFAPNVEAAARINKRLAAVGNLASDGRPILGLDPRVLLSIVRDASPDAHLIPAHVWTPWFSLFGSRSGFDSIEECFEDLTPEIFAMETGLSSDPAMNRRWSALDRYNLLSHSDAHSPQKLGREANLLRIEFSYPDLIRSLRSGEGHTGTVEFYPQEGKYHFDGHRKCGIRLDPDETSDYGGICPVCGKKLTLGVLHRVLQLSDRTKSGVPKRTTAVHHIIPLQEILAEILEVGGIRLSRFQTGISRLVVDI